MKFHVFEELTRNIVIENKKSSRGKTDLNFSNRWQLFSNYIFAFQISMSLQVLSIL